MKYLTKRLLFLFLSAVTCFITATARCASDSLSHEVLLETSLGNIRLQLYNDTPIHRDNFLRLVRSGFYDGILFHRVIPSFMVQAGDSLSREATQGTKLGDTPEPYSLPAEINYPVRYHKAGALAAAREGDEVNPDKRSSAYQFYIVTGRLYDDDGLARAQQHLDETTQGKVRLTPEIKEVYRSFGGMPYLDGQYTVFGEVIEGLDVADRIQWVGRDENDRPFDDVRIIKATVVK